MHTVCALLCFVVVIHWLIFPYPSGLLHWHCGNLTIAPVPAKQPWWIWIHTSCEFIMNDCITTTKQSTTKPCAYFLGYTVSAEYLSVCWGCTGSKQSSVDSPMIGRSRKSYTVITIDLRDNYRARGRTTAGQRVGINAVVVGHTKSIYHWHHLWVAGSSSQLCVSTVQR